MARARRSTRHRRPLQKVRPRPAPLPVEPSAPVEPEDPLDDPEIAQLTDDILQRLSASNSDSVAARAEIGRLLINVQKRLPHGHFGAYLRKTVPFKKKTAERAMNLRRFGIKQPALFDQIARLGMAKAYVLIELPPERIEALVSNKHPIPGTGEEKTPLQMTTSEFFAVALGPPDPDDHGDPEALLRAYRRAMNQAMRAVDALVDRHQEIDPEDLEHHFEGLRLALSRFAATFQLGSDR
jgi:hypothetical protein